MWQVGGEDNGVADSEESASCKVIIAHSRKNCIFVQICIQSRICIPTLDVNVFVSMLYQTANSQQRARSSSTTVAKTVSRYIRIQIYTSTSSQGAIGTPSSSWRPFGPLDFVLCARKGSPTEKVVGSIRALPKWGGVSTLARMVWGTCLEKNCPCSKGHLLVLGGSESLPGWFGALMQ